MFIYDKPTTPVFVKGTPEYDNAQKQIELKKTGLYTGAIDGIWGKKSTKAWEEYQKQTETTVEKDIKVETKETKPIEVEKPKEEPKPIEINEKEWEKINYGSGTGTYNIHKKDIDYINTTFGGFNTTEGRKYIMRNFKSGEYKQINNPTVEDKKQETKKASVFPELRPLDDFYGGLNALGYNSKEIEDGGDNRNYTLKYMLENSDKFPNLPKELTNQINLYKNKLDAYNKTTNDKDKGYLNKELQWMESEHLMNQRHSFRNMSYDEQAKISDEKNIQAVKELIQQTADDNEKVLYEEELKKLEEEYNKKYKTK